jgi:hypothetical protein
MLSTNTTTQNLNFEHQVINYGINIILISPLLKFSVIHQEKNILSVNEILATFGYNYSLFWRKQKERK